MKKWLVAVGAAAIVGAGMTVADVMGDNATVDRVIDGDTIDVSTGSDTIRVRLLNIDTPEIGRDGAPDECLAQEAKQRLEELIPAGTMVTLEYDVERQDRYGRDLAGVFKEGSFINETLVKEGYARAVLFEPNRKFYDRILAAETGPKHKKTGIFGVGVECFSPTPEDSTVLDELQRDAQSLQSMDLTDPLLIDESRRITNRMHRSIDDLHNQLNRGGQAKKFFYAEELAAYLEDISSDLETAEKTLDRTG